MKKIFTIYMSLVLMVEFTDMTRPMASDDQVDQAIQMMGLNCDKKMKDPLSCMTCQIYFESRGEPLAGQLAVAKVTLKRANGNSKYICAKVFERKKHNCQFSWTCDGKSHVMRNPAAVRRAVNMANKAFKEGPDRYDHFYATYISQPVWAQNMSCRTTGRHIFCDGTAVAGYKKVPAAKMFAGL